MTAAATIAFSVALLVVIAIFDRKFAAAGRDDLQVSGTDLVWITAWFASAGVGAILLVRRPSHPVGWLFATLSATIAIIGASDAYASYGLLVNPGSLPGAVCDHTAMLTGTRASRRRGTCRSSSIQASQR